MSWQPISWESSTAKDHRRSRVLVNPFAQFIIAIVVSPLVFWLRRKLEKYWILKVPKIPSERDRALLHQCLNFFNKYKSSSDCLFMVNNHISFLYKLVVKGFSLRVRKNVPTQSWLFPPGPVIIRRVENLFQTLLEVTFLYLDFSFDLGFGGLIEPIFISLGPGSAQDRMMFSKFLGKFKN